MKNKEFVSYEKEVTALVEKVTHTVRIKVGESAYSVKENLKNVPSIAILHEIREDDEGFYGEFIFIEEKCKIV